MFRNKIHSSHRSILAASLVALISSSLTAQGPTGPNKEPVQQEPHVAARAEELSRRPADAAAVLKSDDGVIRYRMDLQLGGQAPVSERELEESLGSFAIDDSVRLSDQVEMVLERELGAPEGKPLVTYYDPQLDLAIAIRKLSNASEGAEANCVGALQLVFNRSGRRHEDYFIYANASSCAATVGSNRKKSTEPDLFLSYLNGAFFETIATSVRRNTIDAVMGTATDCGFLDWEVRINIFKKGKFSSVVSLIGAS